MSQVCILFFVLFKFMLVSGNPGETVMYMPPFEFRTLDRYPSTPQSQANRQNHGQQEILQTNVDKTSRSRSMEPFNTEDIPFSDLTGPFEEVKGSHRIGSDLQQFQTAVIGRDSNNSYRPYPGPYPRPSTPLYRPPAYQNSSPPAVTPAPAVSKLPLLKPDLSTLFKPVTTKVSSKVSGLLGLIPALFSGSSPDGLQMDGLKDILINGIVKPLLEAKGGLKSLISKLSVPIISLLLINLEVLITVWWLWEDCPDEKPPTPTYSYPKPAYNNNNYNSYR